MPPQILFRGNHYSVRQRIMNNDALCVICFQFLSEPASMDGDYFGEHFLSSHKINSIGIKPAANDWYQHDEIFDAISAIHAETAGMTMVGYGSSMGAYGVINYSDALGLQRVFAIAPQFSIDRRRVPDETRWSMPAQRIAFRNDRIDLIPPLNDGWIAFDPWTADRMHAERIMAHHNVKPLPLPLSGHHPGAFLNEIKLNPSLTLDILRGADINAEAIRSQLRHQRQQCPTAWIGASELLWHRGHRTWALRAARKGMEIGTPKHAMAISHYAHLLWTSGEHAAAIQTMERCVEHPSFGLIARQRIKEWGRMAT